MALFTNEDMKRLKEQIKKSEGLRLKAYRCTAGALTIGYGHNCDASPVPGVSRVGDAIPLELAEELFAKDLAKAIAQVLHHLPWVEELEAPRQAVLYDMAFNMGVGIPGGKRGLLSFSRTLPLIRAGEYQIAANNLAGSKWARDVKTRSAPLCRQLVSGKWAEKSNKKHTRP